MLLVWFVLLILGLLCVAMSACHRLFSSGHKQLSWNYQYESLISCCCISGASNLRPAGHIRPAKIFHLAHKDILLKMIKDVFTKNVLIW